MMKRLLIILAILSVQTAAFGQGWQKILTDSFRPATAVNAYGSGYLVAGYMNFTSSHGVMKIDAKGNKQWVKNLIDFKIDTFANELSLQIIRTPDSAYLIHGSNGNGSFTAKKLDQQGNTVWTKSWLLDFGQLKTNKNEYILIGRSRPLSAHVMLKLNLNGDTITQKILGTNGRFRDFDVRNGDILAHSYNTRDFYKLNFDGGNVGTISYPIGDTLIPSEFLRAKDSSYYLGNNGSKRLVKMTQNASSFLWKRPYNYKAYALTNDDGVVGVTSITEFFGREIIAHILIEKIDKMGNSVWKKRLDPHPTVEISDIIACTTGGYLLVGNVYSAIGTGYAMPLYIKIDENGQIYPANMSGKVIKDIDKNCLETAVDKPFSQCLISAKNDVTNAMFWAFSDTTGRYAMNLDSGRYTVSAYPLRNRNFWQNCTPSVSKAFSSVRLADTLNFALKTLIDCPAMDVSVTTPILRRCFNNTYTVRYCNKGTVVANNAYVTVTLDSLLEFINASRPIASQTGRTYRFNLGNVTEEDCGSFDITTRVRCGDSTRLGQTLCVEAKAFPDTICPLPTLWSGANIAVTGACQGDSVLFQIRNTGTAPSSQLNSIVIEDEVLFLTQPFQLPQNGVFSKKFPANGKTWRMVANQEPNHPTSTNPTAFVEGCRVNNSFPISLGYALLFPNDDRASTIDVDCRAIVGAYDPNDKAGYPIGYKSARYIGQNQDIEYLIRFQNTGTDTAFTVVIRDTISDKLDISSLEFGASSHTYEAEIYGKNVLKFTFNNIKLVDSFRNEPKSHGFVRYRIKQQKDLATGSQIFNTAHIYFDYNEPIITNRTLHTVGGKEVITAIFDKNQATNYPIKVSPNPFSSTAIFETPLSINGNFELYDVTGKLLRTERFDGKTFAFQRKDLGAGMYIFKIMVEGRPVSIGKLIVQ